MPVRVTLPVLVSVKPCAGSRVQLITPFPVPGQLRVWDTLQLAGASVALTTCATPVPLSDTGEPVAVTLPVTLTVAFTRLVAVGENTTLIVHVEAAARVAPQVPPAVPAGRE